MASIIGVQTLQHTNGTTAATIDSSGRINTPARPLWAVKGDADAYQTTTNVQFGDIVENVGSVYSTSTHHVTIPVSGYYQINLMMYVRVNNGESGYPRIQKSTDGGTNWSYLSYSTIENSSTGGTIKSTTVISDVLELQANDKLRVVFGGNGDYYNAGQEHRFSGYLIG